MVEQDAQDLEQHRKHVHEAETILQTLAAELILARNAFNDRRSDFNVRVAAQQRVTLVLEALDLVKRAGLVRP